MSIDAVIAADRLLLERLEHFACTPEYARLLDTVISHMDAGSERWLAHWLIRPAYGLGGRPIDIASEPGGVDLLVDQLVRIAYCNCA
jgi:uncharacterized protein (DUF2384 family)